MLIELWFAGFFFQHRPSNFLLARFTPVVSAVLARESTGNAWLPNPPELSITFTRMPRFPDEGSCAMMPAGTGRY